MPDAPSTPTRAVFRSYAREDAPAARRIAEALRSSGVEVWFDESELRGGDAWDAKIRRQINDCTLFLPLISAHTQERGKGYFRLEWKLAVEQTHLMAEGMAFLLPVVLDGTPESGAIVPPEFLRVQWTRLPEGLPTPVFIRQVRQLLEGKGQGSKAAPASPAAVPATPAASSPSRTPLLVGALLAAVAGAAGLWYLVGRPAPAPAVVAVPPAAAAAVPKVAEKSIAVLPFANMSEDKDSAFFTDGIHEDILTHLALIRELKVVSRTSVGKYRGTTKSVGEIARELGVAYILEGSVRRAGNKVRVTGQLIRAATDEHVWAQAYDRDLTDIFAIQSELSQSIASALQATLSPEEHGFLTRRSTVNVAAYDLYLKARSVRERGSLGSRRVLDEANALLEQAVAADPDFALGWAQLAENHALYSFWGFDGTPARLGQADEAIARAQRLAPDAPEVIRLVGSYAYYGYRDYARATALYERLGQLQPNDPTVWNSLGLIMRRQGRWSESLANTRRALALEPGNISYLRDLQSTLENAHRWAEADALQVRLAGLIPEDMREQWLVHLFNYYATGSWADTERWFASLSEADRSRPFGVFLRKNIAGWKGDRAEFYRLDAQLPTVTEFTTRSPDNQALSAALFMCAFGDADRARERLGDWPAKLRARLATEPGNIAIRLNLAYMEAMLGNKTAALALADEAVAIRPVAQDALDGTVALEYHASILALAGEGARAVAELRALNKRPNQLRPGAMRDDPTYHRLKGNAEFEALLREIEERGPLF